MNSAALNVTVNQVLQLQARGLVSQADAERACQTIEEAPWSADRCPAVQACAKTLHVLRVRAYLQA